MCFGLKNLYFGRQNWESRSNNFQSITCNWLRERIWNLKIFSRPTCSHVPTWRDFPDTFGAQNPHQTFPRISVKSCSTHFPKSPNMDLTDTWSLPLSGSKRRVASVSAGGWAPRFGSGRVQAGVFPGDKFETTFWDNLGKTKKWDSEFSYRLKIWNE